MGFVILNTVTALMVASAQLAGQSQTFRVTLLGTAGPSMSLDRAEAGTLVQAGAETLLFDCGRGVPERLSQLGVANVNKIFLTHLHSDHTQGLPVLWMSSWNGRGTNSLYLWGPGTDVDQPAGVKELAVQLSSAFATNTHIRRDLVEKWAAEGIMIQASEVTEGVVYQNNGVTVQAFLVDHAPVKPAFGYRIDYAGRSVVISGDTRASGNLVKFSKGVDVLIHEVFNAAVGSTSATAAYHTLPEQAADVFNRTAPRLAVYSHIAPGGFDPTVRTRAGGYSGPLAVASDLSTIELGDKIVFKACNSTATPAVAAVTNEAYKANLTANGYIIVWGAAFTPEGGNSLRFSRMGVTDPVVLDESTGLVFWNSAANQINAALGTRLSPGTWMLTVKNGCGVTSPAFPITLLEEK